MISRSPTMLGLALAIGVCAATPAADSADSVLRLDGTWQFRLDKTDEGRKAGWMREAPADGWSEIRVPGAWETQGHDYNGVAWYRLQVTVPPSWKGRPVWLQLPVIDETDETYVGGKRIGAMSKNWTDPRFYAVPEDAISWEGPTTITVRITDNYGNGGMSRGEARLFTTGILSEQPRVAHPPERQPLDLGLTDGIAGRIDAPEVTAAKAKGWHYSLRDGGTGDTRPRLHARAGAWDGKDALGMEVWFPTAAMEFIDIRLPDGRRGIDWADRGADYLTFWYQAEMDGEIEVRLSANGIRWGSSARGWGTDISVRTGGWKQAIIPLAMFEQREPRKQTRFLDDPTGLNVLSIGYRNNCLQQAGEIRFAGFQVGAFAKPQVLEPISLAGLWKFSPQVESPPDASRNAWAASDVQDDAWGWILAGRPWESQIQEMKRYDGVAWYRQKLTVPAAWAGCPITLELGTTTDIRDTAEVFFNGTSVGSNMHKDNLLRVTVPAELVRAGATNTIAIRYDDPAPAEGKPSGSGGISKGIFKATPQPCSLTIRQRGAAGFGATPATTDMGRALGKPFDLVLSVAPAAITEPGMRLAVEVVDIFHHRLALTTVPITEEGGRHVAVIPLDDGASRRLVWSEAVDLVATLQRADGTPVTAFAIADQRMDYRSRDLVALPPLAEQVEDTVYGKLRLVDVIDCAADPAAGPHPYKQGGISQSWVGRRAYSTWEQGVAVHEYQGRRYREANNNEWFMYRIGRGIMKPGSAYLLRVVYPEDKTRYQVMNIEAGRNYQGTGFATGVAPGDPFAPYPLSGGYQNYDHIVINDAVTYGSLGEGAKGSRSTDSANGFWVVFMDNGRCYTPEYQAGPAAAEIRLYEIADPAAMAPRIAWPKDARRRTFMTDWEREIEAEPEAMVQTAQFLGYNSMSPAVLKWGSLAWWRTQQNLKATSGVREEMPATGPSPLERWYDATRSAGMQFVPRFEFGGSDSIPKEERAVGKGGGPAQPNRFHTWCADILRESTWKEYEAILDEAVGPFAAQNPQLAGILWRTRQDRQPISYSAYDVGLYIAERKLDQPAFSDDKAAAAWASAADRHEDYQTWWHGKRAEFHKRMLAKLRGYDQRMQLFYYNWDVDGWSLGGYTNKAEDWVDYYSRLHATSWYERVVAHQRTWKPEDYLTLLLAGARHKDQNGKPQHAVRMDLYRDEPGIAMIAPFYEWYSVDTAPYWDYWQAKRGLSAARIGHYEEKGRWNIQRDNYESSEMTPGGPDFAMAEEVLVCWHGDPTLLTWTTYTMGRGFADRNRAFAQAFLALPAQPGVIVADACASADIRVRRYDHGGTTTFGIVHRGFTPLQTEVRLPGTWPAGAALRDLVHDRIVARVDAEGRIAATIDFRPTELRSFRVEAP